MKVAGSENSEVTYCDYPPRSPLSLSLSLAFFFFPLSLSLCLPLSLLPSLSPSLSPSVAERTHKFQVITFWHLSHSLRHLYSPLSTPKREGQIWSEVDSFRNGRVRTLVLSARPSSGPVPLTRRNLKRSPTSSSSYTSGRGSWGSSTHLSW